MNEYIGTKPIQINGQRVDLVMLINTTDVLALVFHELTMLGHEGYGLFCKRCQQVLSRSNYRLDELEYLATVKAHTSTCAGLK